MVIHLLARRAPGLPKALREAGPDFVLLDGTRSIIRIREHQGVPVPADPARRGQWPSG